MPMYEKYDVVKAKKVIVGLMENNAHVLACEGDLGVVIERTPDDATKVIVRFKGNKDRHIVPVEWVERYYGSVGNIA